VITAYWALQFPYIMKHLFLILSFLFLGLLPQAMEAQSSFGIGGSLGADFSEPGLLIRTKFRVHSRWAAVGTFNYYFTTSEVTTLNIYLDVHYGIKQPVEGRKIDSYLILGAHLGQRAFEARQDDRYTDWGMNAGIGLNLHTGGPTFFGELKYVFWGPGAQLVAGVLIPLSGKSKE
jgi:hypothetical protein